MRKTRDRQGRPVVLASAVWNHIVDEHPELEPILELILEAVAAPTQQIRGRRRGEEWLYLAGAGPSRWLKVVVHYEGGEGEIVTAFARRAFP